MSDSESFRCENCRTKYRIRPGRKLSKSAKCPTCGALFLPRPGSELIQQQQKSALTGNEISADFKSNSTESQRQSYPPTAKKGISVVTVWIGLFMLGLLGAGLVTTNLIWKPRSVRSAEPVAKQTPEAATESQLERVVTASEIRSNSATTTDQKPLEVTSLDPILRLQFNPIGTHSIAPDGKTLVASQDKGDVHVYCLPGGELLDRNRGLAGTHAGISYSLLRKEPCMSYSPDGTQLLVGGFLGGIQVWSVAKNGKLHNLRVLAGLDRPDLSVRFLKTSGDNKLISRSMLRDLPFLASFDEAGVSSPSLWDLDTRQSNRELKLAEISVLDAEFSQDGQSIVVLDRQGRIYSLNNEGNLDPVAQMEFPKMGVTRVTLASPPNFVMCSTQHELTCLRIDDSAIDRKFKLPDAEVVTTFALCNQTNEVFIAGRNAVYVFEFQSGTLLSKLALGNVSHSPSHLTVSRDGRFFSISELQNICIFDRGEELGQD